MLSSDKPAVVHSVDELVTMTFVTWLMITMNWLLVSIKLFQKLLLLSLLLYAESLSRRKKRAVHSQHPCNVKELIYWTLFWGPFTVIFMHAIPHSFITLANVGRFQNFFTAELSKKFTIVLI